MQGYDQSTQSASNNIAPVQAADEQLRNELAERAKQACMNAEASEQDAGMWRRIQFACEAALATYEQQQPMTQQSKAVSY